MSERSLLVYYSLEGNTEYAAKIAADHADIDLQRLIPSSEPPKQGFGKFFWGGKSVVFHEQPELMPLEHTPDDYSYIIIAFPVWASSYPPAVASFLAKYPLSGKTVRIIACSAGGNAAKAFDKISAKLDGNTVADTLSLIDPLSNKEDAQRLVSEFVKNIC